MNRQNGSKIVQTAIPVYAPAAEGERLMHIDVLRGIALLGVLLINIDIFSGAYWAMEAHLPYPMGWGGKLLFFLRQALVEGKAAALLSILFGAGMMMQMERAQSRGRAYWSFAMRRMGVLALIGLAHSLLLWNGDILIDYAILGLMVLPFMKARPSRLFWIIPLLIVMTSLAVMPFIHIIEKVDQNPAWVLQMEQQHFGIGTWLDALKYRSWETIHLMGPMRIGARLPMCVPFSSWVLFSGNWAFSPNLNSMYANCVGCSSFSSHSASLPTYFPSNGSWPGPAASLRPLRVLLSCRIFSASRGWSSAIWQVCCFCSANHSGKKGSGHPFPTGAHGLDPVLAAVAGLLHCCLWFRFRPVRKTSARYRILAPAAFFALQVWSSRLWLRNFYMGPAEWVWRSLAYGMRPPFPAEDLTGMVVADMIGIFFVCT